MFQSWHGLIFRTACRITGNAADAEDVLQTVFLRLLRSGGGAGIANPESYFRRAAIHASLDVLRVRSHCRAALLDDRVAAAPDPAEMRQAVRRALAGLDAESAELIALRYLEGVPNQRIAEMLGKPAVLVAVRLFRARQRLRRELAGIQ